MVLPGAFPKTSLTGTSSNDLKSNTTFTFSHDPLSPFHKIRNAGVVDPSVRLCLVTAVVKVPRAYLGVSTVYMTESVSESRMVVLRISSSLFEVNDRFRFILGGGGLVKWGDAYGGS